MPQSSQTEGGMANLRRASLQVTGLFTQRSQQGNSCEMGG